MSTPQRPDAAPAPSVINWYFGPVRWDPRPEAMWHALCPDPYATGHDGEVWLDHHRGAFCTGCRHYEPGQAEQDIPPERLAEIPAQAGPRDEPVTPPPTSTETVPPPSPDEAAATSSAGADEVAATSSADTDQAAATSSADADGEGEADGTDRADASPTRTPGRPGLLKRLKDAVEAVEGDAVAGTP